MSDVLTAHPKKTYIYSQKTLIKRETRRAEMISMFMSGQTMTQIGRHFGVSRETVRQQLKKVGFTGRDGGISKISADIAKARHEVREKQAQEKYGCSLAEYRTIPKKGRRAFLAQKNGAKARSVEWRLTLWEWWCIWRDSGKWDDRGVGVDKYVMGRYGDVGPYSTKNVYIVTGSENCSAPRPTPSEECWI